MEYPPYTRSDIPHMITALKAARRMIEAKQQVFICFALDRHAHNNRFNSTITRGCTQASRLVMRALSPYSTLDVWMKAKGHSRKLTPYDPARRKRRLRWIDKMIKDLESYAAS